MTRLRIALTTIALGIFAAPLMLAQTTSTPAQTAKPTAAKPTAAKPTAAAVPPAGAKAFATAQAAVDALIQAATAFDEPALIAIFGPDNKDLVTTGDAVRDKSYAAAFSALAKEGLAVAVNPSTPSRATLEVGKERWPLPVPLVKVAGKWYFDAKAGRDEILFRRVGANELDAIEVCRGFVEAQKQYALDLHDDSKVHQYAQRIISTPGKQDGLFWRNADGSEGGPISESVAKAIEEGYAVEKGVGLSRLLLSGLEGPGPPPRRSASSTT
jgi:hypothetical protein